MTRIIITSALTLWLSLTTQGLNAQDQTLYFRTSDPGVTKAITTWGVDTAWPSVTNMRNGLIHMGPDQIDTVRLCFFADEPLTPEGELGEKTKERLDLRVRIASMAGDKPWALLPGTEDGVHEWYKDGDKVRPDRWVQMLEVTQKYLGKPIAVIEPFNEPDWGWGQGTPEDLREVFRLLRKSPHFKDTKLAGPATLNSDAAIHWYDVIKDEVTIGSTHTLAGSFRSYIDFMQHAQANGDEVSQPEAHSVIEAIAGAEYGLSDCTWWGPPFLVRGLFVKSCQGKRLAYVEDLGRWAAGAVYRAPDGAVRAFLSTVERQSTPTTFRLVSGDHPIWYNGEGPMYDFTLTIGKHGEEFVDITDSMDVPTALNNRRFVIINRQTGQALQISSDNAKDGAPLKQAEYNGSDDQKWDVVRVRHGYYTFKSTLNEKPIAITDWDLLDDGVPVCQSGDGTKELQQWFTEYVGQGYFHIRNRHTGKYIQIAGGDVVQGAGGAGEAQQWRVFPAAYPVDYEPPATPTGLTAAAGEVSVALDWQDNADSDIACYIVYRADGTDGKFHAIATTEQSAYVDPSANRKLSYRYAIRARDHALNYSDLSTQASADPTSSPTLITHLKLDNDLLDSEGNGYHATATGSPAFAHGKLGNAVVLDGKDDFLTLPYAIINKDSLTVATWVYWEGGPIWQRVFDFGNDQEHNLFLTLNSNDGTMRFAIKNGGEEQRLNTEPLPEKQWTHVAVVLHDGLGKLYVNGVLKDSQSITIKPSDFDPVSGWIGKSSYPDPLFHGMIDDLRIYNYALPENQIQGLGRTK